MRKVNKILIAPLDWGLGHGTRCIPIINRLIQLQAEVVIAADGEVKSLLEKEFPNLKVLHLKGYGIRYSSLFPVWLAVFIQFPLIFLAIWKEHRWLKITLEKENFSAIISDNRFGLWNKKVSSIYITHQLMIKCPQGLKFLEPLLYRLHHLFISRYDECWIPDFASKEKNLSGDLSHSSPLPQNAKFIGPLSRFNSYENGKNEYDIAAVISGAEPQRTIFEARVKNEFNRTSLKTIIIKGKPSEKAECKNGTVSHLDARNLEQVLISSELAICRSGYSTVMDLVRIKKNAVLIPTPGQTEQEYLAEELMRKGIFFSMKQSEFNLLKAIEQSKKFSVRNFDEEDNGELLAKALSELINYPQRIQE